MLKRTAATVLLLFWACCGTAAAQAAEPQPPQPPQLLPHGAIPYPPGASGTGEVLLEAVIDTGGRVAEVVVVSGDAPFAGHAADAVAGWRFAPATDAGVPVAARIRLRVVLSPPVADASPPASAANPGAAEGPPVQDTAPDAAVTPEPVEGASYGATARTPRTEVGQTRVHIEEARALPGGLGDPFRAIEALPSVTPVASGLPYFFVRGAPPNNNAFYFEGVRVPLLFHVALGPGVIHPGLFDGVTLDPGPAPASVGGAAGAVVSASARPPGQRTRGEASLRLIDASALLERPFSEGRGTALVAGRYGYPGPIVSALSTTTLEYWDYQGRLSWQLADHHDASLLAFGSHDVLGHLEDGQEVEDLASDFHRLDLRYDYGVSRHRVRVGLTLGHDQQGSHPVYATDHSAALRVLVQHRVTDLLRVRYGLQGMLDAYGLRAKTPIDPQEAVVPASADPPPKNLRIGAHADVVWRPLRWLQLVPGVRADAYGSQRRPAGRGSWERTVVPTIEPRLSVRTELTPRVALLTAVGVAHQYPTLRIGPLPAAVASVPGFALGSRTLQRSLQASQGVEAQLPAALTLRAVGFGTRMTGLTDLTASCMQIERAEVPAGQRAPDLGPFYCPSDEPVRGHSYGVEWMLKRAMTETLSGWVAYTLSRSVRRARFLTFDGDTAEATVPSEFDRTHVLNLVMSYAFSATLRLGGRLVMLSGAPYSELSGSLPVPPYNSRRDPPFVRLDLRFEKRWSLGRTSFIALIIEGQNVTLSNQPNPLGQTCNGSVSGGVATTECERGDLGPLTIPNIGVEAAF